MQTDKKTILVVDDDRMVNDILEMILSVDYHVLRSFNADEAFDKVKSDNVDLVITDYNMPGKTGIELLIALKEFDSNLPVVVITGFSDIDIAISALKNGAVDFILKPFKADQILLSTSKSLENAKLKKENVRLVEELQEKNSELLILNENIQARNVSLENEFDIASNLQQCLFPLQLPNVKNVNFSLQFDPVEKISGDFFDFIYVDEKRFTLVFADVSGHGVPAALYSAMVKTAISTVDNRVESPAFLINEVNSFLIKAQKTMSYSYATICCITIDFESQILRYCNAGIPEPILLHKQGDFSHLEANGPFVGIFDDSNYEDLEIELQQGDKILFFTDGAYEHPSDLSINDSKNLFYKKIKRMYKDDIETITEMLFRDSKEGQSRSEIQFNDDITILAMEFNCFR